MGLSKWVITPRHSILLRCSLTFRCTRQWGISWGHMYYGMNIMSESDLAFASGNLPIPVNWSGNSFIKSSVDLMDLAAVWTVAALVVVAVVEAGAWELEAFMPCHMTVMAQFIFTTASLLHGGKAQDGRTGGVMQHTSMKVTLVGSSTRAA